MSESILFELRYYLSLLKRRFLLILIPACIAFGLAVVVTFMIPPLYEIVRDDSRRSTADTAGPGAHDGHDLSA